MLGRIRWGSGHKIKLYHERILGLPVLTAEMPCSCRSSERTVRKAARLLRKNRVVRVLTPPDFPWWPLLKQAGLGPVDTARLRWELVPVWVTAQLCRLEVPRERAILCLSGAEREPALHGSARALCPLVRGLVFDLPGGGEVADCLRKQMGMPVLPRDFDRVHLTLLLRGGPVLTGAEITLPGRTWPADCDGLPLLSALWEAGRIKAEEIALKI